MRGGGKMWRKFPVEMRLRAISDALAVVRDSGDATKLFAVAVRKAKVSPTDSVEYAFEEVCKRFDKYLMRLFKAGNKQRGIIVFDKATYETTIQNLAADFRSIGHKWGVVRNLSEVPLFLDSESLKNDLTS